MKAGVKEGDRIIKVSGPARAPGAAGPGVVGAVAVGGDRGIRCHALGLP